jgi:hypothetical protein
MAAKRLDKAEWAPFLAELTKTLKGAEAEIEVESLEIGDQVEANWLPLFGIVYDHKGDLVEIAMEGLDHLIYKPREIYVDRGATGLASLEIVSEDGTRQIIQLREPLMLPAPG